MADPPIDEIKRAIRPHVRAKNWWSAREVFQQYLDAGISDPDTKKFVLQRLALSTYKDPELRREAALRG